MNKAEFNMDVRDEDLEVVTDWVLEDVSLNGDSIVMCIRIPTEDRAVMVKLEREEYEEMVQEKLDDNKY